MGTIQGILYLAAVILVLIAAFGVRTRINLALLGGGIALLAYTLPTITSL